MRLHHSYLICTSIAAALLIFSGKAVAQFNDSMGGAWNNAMSASASTMIWSSIFYRTPAASKGASRPTTTRGAASTAPPGSKPADTSAVKFRPTGAYLKTKEFADSLGNTPAEREQYAKLMNAVLDAFAQQSTKAGFANDLGAALAFFIGENIRIYRGLPDLTDQQYVDLRNAIAGALISSGGLTNMTDRQKQEMYEALVAYTGITQFGYEQARQAGNDSVAKGYQKVAGQNLQTVTKISPDKINYGPEGLSVLQ